MPFRIVVENQVETVGEEKIFFHFIAGKKDFVRRWAKAKISSSDSVPSKSKAIFNL
jgi:hypothetical protein